VTRPVYASVLKFRWNEVGACWNTQVARIGEWMVSTLSPAYQALHRLVRAGSGRFSGGLCLRGWNPVRVPHRHTKLLVRGLLCLSLDRKSTTAPQNAVPGRCAGLRQAMELFERGICDLPGGGPGGIPAHTYPCAPVALAT
jgi:hypothetical protein